MIQFGVRRGWRRAWEVKVRKVMVSMGEERDRGSMNKRGVGWEFER